MTDYQALRDALAASLDALTLRVTVARGGYPGHALVTSDLGAIDMLAKSVAARLPAADPSTIAALLAERDALRDAISKADDYLNVKGDPIAAHITLFEALSGVVRLPDPVATPADPSALCDCGHRRDHHINRDVDDVVGWPCLDCRSSRCRGFALKAGAQ